MRLKTYVLWLAATGMRAGEACSIRMMDLDLDNRKVYIQGEHTKTRIDRWVFLTKELCESLLSWFEYKYRPRKRYYRYDNVRKNYVKLKEPVVFTPARNETDFIFGLEFENSQKHKKQKRPEEPQSIRALYCHLIAQFDKVLDRLGVGYEDATKKRRKITLHSFRRYVKSTISDLGYSDFSEWFIGHAVSTYHRKSDKEKFQLFKRLEESLTYLDQSSLEQKHADVVSRLEAKDSEIAHLSAKVTDLQMDKKKQNEDLLGFLQELKEDFKKQRQAFEDYKKTHP